MKIIFKNIIKLSSIAFISLLVAVFAYTEISNASKYITKKSKTSEETEQIDKMYAEGLLSKSECIKAKTKVLKLPKEVKTICDNVVVKKVKKKIKKEHKKKKKDLSKEATSYITKKKTKTKHYQTIAEIPNSEFYFYAVDEKNLFYIGFVNQDKDSKMLTVGTRKFRKGNKGRAYISDGKTNCSVYSEVDENAKSERIYTGTAIINCTDKRYFIGNWVQKGEVGKGIAIDEDGTALEFNFSMDRKIAMVSFDKIKKGDTKIATIVEEPFKPDKDVKKRFKPKIITKLEIESKKTCFIIKGSITNEDYPSSKEFFMEIDGEAIDNKKGNFSEERCSLRDKEYFVRATNEYGKYGEVVVKVKVKRDTKSEIVKIESLNPSKFKIKKNPNRLAVIIGIEKYEQTAKASFAKKDAEWFKEYAQKAFGVTENNTKMLLDEKATLTNSNLALSLWLRQRIIPNRSELIIFFSGHGLANKEGTELYMMAQNSHPDALEDTAILRTKIVEKIKSYKPKSVIMFFDTCYSGDTREKDGYLVASTKGLRAPIKAESEFPENFTVFTSSKNDQSSSGFPKAKHGIFSYLLMKGLEGKADTNKDRKITNEELFAYLESNVKEKAISIWGREQDPSFFGKKTKVLSTY